MADPLVRLVAADAAVKPGGQARVGVTIANPGTVVEGYELLVLGAAAPWAEVVPAEVSVYPRQEVSAAVVFSPPDGAGAPGGTQPFAVLARSLLDPDASATAEGDVEIAEVHGLQAKLVPVTSTGRWRGRHALQLTNTGNTPATLRLSASNPDEALGFYLQPEVVDLAVQGSAVVRLSVRTRHPFLRGVPVRLPFQLVGELLDDDGEVHEPSPRPGGMTDSGRTVVDGALNQRPILSKPLLTLLTLVVVGAVGLAGYLLLNPKTSDEVLAGRGADKAVLQAATAGPDSLTLRWDAVTGAESYNLLTVDAPTGAVSGQQALPGSLTTYRVTGLTPGTEYCFTLNAVVGGLGGPLADKACATTAAGPPSPSPSPSATPSPSLTPAPPSAPSSEAVEPMGSASASASPVPGDSATDPLMKGRWITVVQQLPTDLYDRQAAEQSATGHVALGVPVAVADSRVYPDLRYDGSSPSAAQPETGWWLVYLGPYADAAQATAGCQDILTKTQDPVCVAAQPDPPA